MARTRNFVPLLVLMVAAGSFLTACSSDSSSARSAASATGISTEGFSRPTGDPNVSVNVGQFCLRPQDSDGDSGFATLRNIVVCNVMTNETRRFTAPGVLSGKFPLGVTKAYCSDKDDTCIETSGSYYGRVRTEGTNASNSPLKGDRYTTPNPFMGTAAIQFQPNKIWQGVETRTFVGSNVAPFDLTAQSPVELWVNVPTTGSNSANCTSGSWISCKFMTTGFDSGSDKRAEFVLTTQPLRIQINNNSGRPMSAISPAVNGQGFLPDAIGSSPESAFTTLPTGSVVWVAGYRSANSSADQSWTREFCINTATGCVTVSITVKLGYSDGKVTNLSQCNVVNRSATATYKCNTPVVNESDADRVATVNITDF